MEIIIAIVLIGVLVGFAVPNYSKMMRKNQERTAITQLNTIYAAAQLYNDAAGNYLGSGGAQGAAWINTNLDLNVIDRNMAITYTSGGASTFTATAVLDSGATVTIDQDTLSTTNPCCGAAGTCLIVPDC